MTITHITSISQLNGILSKNNEKLTVIDFHATWCGPCHTIAPTFEALAKQYPNVNFLKCDVDAAKDVAGTYRVAAMPTFIFLRGDKQVRTIKGADKHGLQTALRQFATSSGTFPGAGNTLGGSSSSEPTPGDGANTAGGTWTNLDPQLKILLALVAAYVFFWLM
ncbi:thioredoxin-like protein [Scleroderma yunnanense]